MNAKCLRVVCERPADTRYRSDGYCSARCKKKDVRAVLDVAARLQGRDWRQEQQDALQKKQIDRAKRQRAQYYETGVKGKFTWGT